MMRTLVDPAAVTVVVATQHLARNGGVGVHVLRVADTLRAQGRRVVLVAGRVSDDVRGEDVHEVPGLEARRIAGDALRRLDAVLGGLPRPVVTHVHHLWDPALLRSLRRGGPVVWSLHEFAACPTGNLYFEPGHECHRAHGPGCIPHILFHGCAHTWNPRSLPGRYRRTAQHAEILRSADAVLAYSGFVARHARRNGVRAVRVAPLIVPDVPGWTPPPATPRVLFAGRVTPNKGLEPLLKAVRRLGVELDVVGDGWWRADAEGKARDLGLDGRVAWHGWQPPDRVDALYRGATVVAVPSLWPEPFGMVGPEAMAHGRPVVASDTGGIPEWLDHGRTGFLVATGDDAELADALGTIIADPALARSMGETGAAEVRDRFSREAHVAALDTLHSDVLAARV